MHPLMKYFFGSFFGRECCPCIVSKEVFSSDHPDVDVYQCQLLCTTIFVPTSKRLQCSKSALPAHGKHTSIHETVIAFGMMW